MTIALSKSKNIFVLAGMIFLACILGAITNNFAAYFLMAAVYYALFMNTWLTTSQKKILLTLITIHQLIVLLGSHFLPAIITNSPDLTNFNILAKEISEANAFSFSVNAQFYANILAIFYKMHAPFFFIREMVIVSFYISCISLLRLCYYLGLEKYSNAIVCVFGLWPTYLLWGTIPLREPFQIMLFLLAFETLMMIKLSKMKKSLFVCYLLAACLFLVFLSFMHNGLVIILPLLLPIFIASAFIPIKNTSPLLTVNRFRILGVTSAIVIVLAFLFIAPLIVQGTIQKWAAHISGNKIHLPMIEKSKQSGPRLGLAGWLTTTAPFVIHLPKKDDGSTFSRLYTRLAELRYESAMTASGNYDNGQLLKTQNTFEIIAVLAVSYVKYVFGPFIINSLPKRFLPIAMISMMRALLFIGSVYFCLSRFKEKKIPFILFFMTFILVTNIYSVGTINYGTAIRHNMLTDWILILFGVPALCESYFSFMTDKKFNLNEE